MATCAVIGQAVGTAAALAVRHGLTPRETGQQKIADLKQALMEDDCYLPWNSRRVPALSRTARLSAAQGQADPLRNGIDRPVGGVDNGWSGSPGDWVEYAFENYQPIRYVHLVFDSDLNRQESPMAANYPLHMAPVGVPQTLVRAFRIEALREDGSWQVAARVTNNYQRQVRLECAVVARAVRFIPEATWGAEKAHLFAFDVA